MVKTPRMILIIFNELSVHYLYMRQQFIIKIQAHEAHKKTCFDYFTAGRDFIYILYLV
jgi:hypothetical protein